MGCNANSNNSVLWVCFLLDAFLVPDDWWDERTNILLIWHHVSQIVVEAIIGLSAQLGRPLRWSHFLRITSECNLGLECVNSLVALFCHNSAIFRAVRIVRSH